MPSYKRNPITPTSWSWSCLLLALAACTPPPPATPRLQQVSIQGTAREGETLLASLGGWSPPAGASLGHQWSRCDGQGQACAAITGASAERYGVTAEDAEATLKVSVQVTGQGTPYTVDSAPTASVLMLAPVSTAAPTVPGNARVGSPLTGAPGTWRSARPPSYAYQWSRCDAAGAACAPIAGATSVTYAPVEDDLDATLRLRVTASNAGGSASAESQPTDPVRYGPPVNTVPPTISGTLVVGGVLLGDEGTWESALSFDIDSYQWLRCDETGSGCVPIEGAMGSYYFVEEADRARTLRFRVTASNMAGEASAESKATSLVLPQPPTNTAQPTISGLAVLGETLTGDPGAWDSTPPPSYAYQWLRCDLTGSGCVAIPGASSSTYVVADADVAATLRLRITASNPGGQQSAESAPSSGVLPCANVSQQGPFLPASARTVAQTLPWNNVSAAQRADGTYATSGALSPGDITDTLMLRNWGFSIPTHAQILGIRAQVKRSSTSGAGVMDYLVRLVHGDFRLNNRAQPGVWGTTDAVVTYGGATDTWEGNHVGEPWTAWDLNDPAFGIMLVARHAGGSGTDTARVDSVELTIFYRDATALGPNSPTVVADDASIGTVAWSNPQNAAAMDTVYARTAIMVNNQLTHYLKATGFNFTPLPGRTPSGIVVEIRKKERYSQPFKDEVVRLVQGGVVVGDNRPVEIHHVMEPKYSVHGRSTDLWGLTPTEADLASPDFGVALASRYASNAGAGQAQIDHIRMWLLYDPFDTQVSRPSGTITSEQFSRDWDLADNARLEDGARAAVYGMVNNEVSSALETSGYGFTLPANARVAGVQLQVLRSSLSGVGVYDYRVRLRGPGQGLSSNRALPEVWKTTPQRITYGQPADPWGVAWTPADINDPAFGASFETHYPGPSGNDYAYVDSTALTVFYCPP